MADHTVTWNSAFNLTPADNTKAGFGDDRFRELKTAVSERMQKDHNWENSITDGAVDQDGTHTKVTMKELGSDPTNIANGGIVYPKDVGGVTELFYIDSAGNVIQLSTAGDLGKAGQTILGNFTGDVTGDVTGNVTGNLSGNVTGNVTGYATKAWNVTSSSSVVIRSYSFSSVTGVGPVQTYLTNFLCLIGVNFTNSSGAKIHIVEYYAAGHNIQFHDGSNTSTSCTGTLYYLASA